MENNEETKHVEEFIKFYNNYSNYTNGEKINFLLKEFEIFNPNWVAKYNKMMNNLKKRHSTGTTINDELVYMHLPEDYSINEILVENPEQCKDDYEEIMLRGRIVHASNKMAHIFDEKAKNIISKYIDNTHIKYTREERKKIYNRFFDALNPNSSQKQKEVAINTLTKKYKFKRKIFGKKEGKTNSNIEKLSNLIEARDYAYAIKSLEILKINEKAIELEKNKAKEDKRRVSYGKSADNIGKPIFSMDIDNFGQFGVHMPNKSVENHVIKKYSMPAYQVRTIVLNDYRNEVFMKFLDDSMEDNSFDEEITEKQECDEETLKALRLEKAIKDIIYKNGGLNKGQAHEVAVKAGLELEHLQNIENDLEL